MPFFNQSERKKYTEERPTYIELKLEIDKVKEIEMNYSNPEVRMQSKI